MNIKLMLKICKFFCKTVLVFVLNSSKNIFYVGELLRRVTLLYYIIAI